MSRFLTILLSVLTLAQAVCGQSLAYTNNGVVSSPQIDAINVINNGTIYATNNTATTPFFTYDTLNFTNNNLMIGTIGFQFDHSPSGSGRPNMANNFVNANSVSGSNSWI